MKHLILIVTFILIYSYGLQAQEKWIPFKRYHTIQPLENGKYEIKEYTKDSIPIYKGVLSSVDPEVRHGKFYFLDRSGLLNMTGFGII